MGQEKERHVPLVCFAPRVLLGKLASVLAPLVLRAVQCLAGWHARGRACGVCIGLHPVGALPVERPPAVVRAGRKPASGNTASKSPDHYWLQLTVDGGRRISAEPIISTIIHQPAELSTNTVHLIVMEKYE